MRDGIRAIVSGWMMTDDTDALADRAHRALEFINDNRPAERDETETLTMIMEVLAVREVREKYGEAAAADMVDMLGQVRRH